MAHKLKICNQNYRIKRSPVVVDMVDGGCYGIIDYSKLVIDISRSQAETHAEESLLHEVIHGIAHHMRIGSDALSHKDVHLIANSLHGLGVGKFLMEKAGYGATGKKAPKNKS